MVLRFVPFAFLPLLLDVGVKSCVMSASFLVVIPPPQAQQASSAVNPPLPATPGYAGLCSAKADCGWPRPAKASKMPKVDQKIRPGKNPTGKFNWKL